MDAAARLRYLQAMDIDVWVARHPPGVCGRLPSDDFADADGRQPVTTLADADVSGLVYPQTSALPVNPSPDAEAADERSELGQAEDADHDGCASTQELRGPGPENAAEAWQSLQHSVAVCRACALCETRTQTVFGVGNKQATWMLIGEAPGQNEDLQGEPFVGKAGQLLNEMLKAIGLQREQVYIANMLKCRPPNNRDPQAEEVAACHDFLQRQIQLLQPKILLAVGRIAAQNLLDTQQPLSRLRGKQYRLGDLPLVVVHHPAYLLRSPLEKAKAWEDLQFAWSVYQSL
ncbi:uracil-DNA glycosylase [Methylomonas rhizoryzae]|uniref:uracil-DNA glycosylase n=1 Tax=Methylomonas rhizoryzae TaxID=2608981 RepID=UPI0012326FF5|nr:uracil-DNA glycosylase [Methylomonas rhizoryzae]